MGSESLFPDRGHVAQSGEQSSEKGQVGDSIASVTTMRIWPNGLGSCLPSKLRGFDSRYPLHAPLAQRQSS